MLLMLQQKESLPLFCLFSGRTLDVSHLLILSGFPVSAGGNHLPNIFDASFSHIPNQIHQGILFVLLSKKIQTLPMSHHLHCYCKSSPCNCYLTGCQGPTPGLSSPPQTTLNIAAQGVPFQHKPDYATPLLTALLLHPIFLRVKAKLFQNTTSLYPLSLPFSPTFLLTLLQTHSHLAVPQCSLPAFREDRNSLRTWGL